MGRAHEVRKKAMAATAAKKTKLYSKYGKEIYLAAKNGDANPEMNVSLKRVIEKAKREQVPSEIIKRNIDKAKSGAGENYVSVSYEGFGPNNSSFIVECLTDNINRTVSNVRSYFTKNKGKLGVTGSVTFSFVHYAIISVKGLSEETLFEDLMLAEIEVANIETEEDITTIYADPTNFYAIKDALESAHPGIEYIEDDITWVPNEFVTLSDEDKVFFDRIINSLDEDDDVQDYYHNGQED
jgi:YebC/PmpR family DNA-binding regulatory protein